MLWPVPAVTRTKTELIGDGCTWSRIGRTESAISDGRFPTVDAAGPVPKSGGPVPDWSSAGAWSCGLSRSEQGWVSESVVDLIGVGQRFQSDMALGAQPVGRRSRSADAACGGACRHRLGVGVACARKAADHVSRLADEFGAELPSVWAGSAQRSTDD